MKQGKNKRNNTQNLKEYIQQLAQTGIKEPVSYTHLTLPTT